MNSEGWLRYTIFGPELESIEVEHLKERLSKMPHKWRLKIFLYPSCDRRQPYYVGVDTLQYQDYSKKKPQNGVVETSLSAGYLELRALYTTLQLSTALVPRAPHHVYYARVN